MSTSRLYISTNAKLRDAKTLKQYCDKHKIPYSEDFHSRILPSEDLKQKFDETYSSITALPPTTLKEHGSPTVAVFESKIEGNHHGDVVAAVAQQIGSRLNPAVETIYIHRSLNLSYRQNNPVEKEDADAVKFLVESQGIPVLHTSIGWNDRLLGFNTGHKEQENHLFRVPAFVVDSAGNDGKYGDDGKLIPYQKHNALTHLSPLVVRVGAAAWDEKNGWNIEGYSSANSPTFLTPVASKTNVVWKEGRNPEPLTGTSASAPYASGVLAALNHRYGAYLTREQILYAVMATCTPIKHVNAFGKKTPEPIDIEYKKNAAGLSYNPEYGGFGLIHNKNADKLLSQMVNLTQKNPKSITTPTGQTVTLIDAINTQIEKDGLYHYSINMPAGFALKTTIEADFVDGHGKINITSPSGTEFPMVMSALDSKKHHFGMSTSHGWAGEELKGIWNITSTHPIKQLCLRQHHFLALDIIHQLDIPKLLTAEIPDLSRAVRLTTLKPGLIQRVIHGKTLPESAEPRGLMLGEAKKSLVAGDTESVIEQLQKLPSGFKKRHNKKGISELIKFDYDSPVWKLELEAGALISDLPNHTTGADEIRHQIIEKELAVIDEYEKLGKSLEQIIPLSNIGTNYLDLEEKHYSEDTLNAEKAVEYYTRALRIAKRDYNGNRLYSEAYNMNDLLFTALCRCCEQGKADKYRIRLEQVCKQAVLYSREKQGPIEKNAHRIEEGEYGFSSNEKIGTCHLSQCIAIIAQDPLTLKTGVVHVDYETDIKTLDNFFSQFGRERLNIRLVGGRFDSGSLTRNIENIMSVINYMSNKDVNIISADICGGNEGPSTFVVDPHTFTIEEKVPGRVNKNQDASNAIILFAQQGKPLINQFDLTHNYLRNPIHLNTRMLNELRSQCFGKEIWEMEKHLISKYLVDHPLSVTFIRGLEGAYNEEWYKLTKVLETAITEHGITGGGAQQARDALSKQSLYIGEHAEAANAPIFDWIRNRLFKDGTIQRTEIKGPTAHINIYDPKGPPQEEGFVGLVLQNNSSQQQKL